MTAQSVETVLEPRFLEQAAHTLQSDGFVTDEHDFAPYRETIAAHYRAIEHALNEQGYAVHLGTGFLQHPQAGYAYFIYDNVRFPTASHAERAVAAWLTEQYGG
jgi:hypothetical protein